MRHLGCVDDLTHLKDLKIEYIFTQNKFLVKSLHPVLQPLLTHVRACILFSRKLKDGVCRKVEYFIISYMHTQKCCLSYNSLGAPSNAIKIILCMTGHKLPRCS